MNKIELDIVALTHTATQTQNYAIVLGEKKGNRRLPIIIGAFEAQAIALAMENMSPGRPLTHDLMKNVLGIFQVNLKEIVINNLLEGIFYAKLVCDHKGKEIEIDARSSDAIAMAVRFNCPIYTFEFILESAGIDTEDENDDTSIELPDGESNKTEIIYSSEENLGFKKMDLKELKSRLQKALEKEDYLTAAKIRDEIKNR